MQWFSQIKSKSLLKSLPKKRILKKAAQQKDNFVMRSNSNNLNQVIRSSSLSRTNVLNFIWENSFFLS